MRAGTTQTAISRLERPGSNPRIATLERVLQAAGHRLTVQAAPGLPDVDEAQIEQHLRMTPAERAAAHRRAYGKVHALTRKARRVG